MKQLSVLSAVLFFLSAGHVHSALRLSTEEKKNRELDETCSADDYKIPEGVTGPTTGPLANLPLANNLFNVIILAIGASVNLSETPIAIRIFSLLDSSLWNCVASYDDKYQDAIRRGQRPVVEVPNPVCGNVDPHTTEARAQCLVHVYAAAIPTIVPDAIQAFQNAVASLNYTTPFSMGLHPDIEACQSNESYDYFKVCLNEVAENHDYKPFVVASAIVADMLHYANNSGWNMDGTNGGECEYNCRPYADTIGYTPRNYPGVASTSRKKLWKGGKGKKSSKSTAKSGRDEYRRYWQPLLEDDGRGFFFRQEHVTPHIGFKAHPRLFTRDEIDNKVIDAPEYNLVREADLVVKRLRSLTDKTKMEVEHFDNKSTVAGTLYLGLIPRYGAKFTFERVILWVACFLAAEEDATILAWKEKIRHDLVRPTTVIQQSARYGTPEYVTTWAGPGQTVETFAAYHFQPYIRVMPHAEFPSGSACICQAGEDAMKGFMNIVFNDDANDFKLSRSFGAGSSIVEPGITPANDITLEFDSLEDFRKRCGQSRLNGGMHFTASVPEGYNLGQGFQPKVEELIMELLNGKTDLITHHTIT